MPAGAPTFDLRPAGAADFAFAWRVYREVMQPLTEELLAWRELRQKAAVKEALADGGSAIIVVPGAEAGWLQARDTAQEVSLAHIYILPAWQNRGIGSAIFQQLEERARQAQKTLALDVMTNNPARAFYERRGFRVVGRSLYKIKMRWPA